MKVLSSCNTSAFIALGIQEQMYLLQLTLYLGPDGRRTHSSKRGRSELDRIHRAFLTICPAQMFERGSCCVPIIFLAVFAILDRQFLLCTERLPNQEIKQNGLKIDQI